MVHGDKRLSTAPGRSGMVVATQHGEERQLTPSLLSFQLQGDDAGLPIPLGHPHEHNWQAWWRPPWSADFLLPFQAGNWQKMWLWVRWSNHHIAGETGKCSVVEDSGGNYLTKDKHGIWLTTLNILLHIIKIDKYLSLYFPFALHPCNFISRSKWFGRGWIFHFLLHILFLITVGLS